MISKRSGLSITQLESLCSTLSIVPLLKLYVSLLSDKTLIHCPGFRQESRSVFPGVSLSCLRRWSTYLGCTKVTWDTHNPLAAILGSGVVVGYSFGMRYPRAIDLSLCRTIGKSGRGSQRKSWDNYLKKELSSPSWEQWPDDTSHLSMLIVMELLRHHIPVREVRWRSQAKRLLGSHFWRAAYSAP